MTQLPKKYNFIETEEKLQKFWQDKAIYNWDKNSDKANSYIIDTPPPTVSGQLHIGHVFSYTHTDFIARFQRMRGKNVFYPIGFDDNGLPTERLVEKVKNIKATNYDRTEFITICKQVITEEEEKFRQTFNSIALSVDWTQEYQTISDRSRALSQMSFLDLIQKNEIYRDNQPILWDPVDQTALSQADIEDKEKPSQMNEILFRTDNGQELKIATTRPELLPACVAVFYHPDDERYKHLSGKKAITPLFEIEVPIIADEKVAIDKGTGLVMCCTFGDNMDIEWWKIHKLPMRMILSKKGSLLPLEIVLENFSNSCLNIKNAEQYYKQIEGQYVKKARQIILDILAEKTLLLSQTDIIHSVKCAERSGAPLEIITAPQWFVKILDKKELLKEKAKQINWYPHYMKNRLDNWINALSWDWCISRQRYFGVPFPVWYSKRPGEEGKVIFAQKEQLPVDPLKDLPQGYEAHEVEPDYDVMDTWATSSISPQLNSHAVSPEFAVSYQRHQELYPANLRAQAHEIIRTWAFYTIVKSLCHENQVPWKDIMISGWCLAENRDKMSKSKGNVVVPATILQNYGADCLRYWTSSAKLGADTAYSEDILKNGKRLINKLLNAAKFTSQHFELLPNDKGNIKNLISSGIIYAGVDLWILHKLQKLIFQVTESFEKYEYCVVRSLIEEFFWKDFCDNYLEIVKMRSYDEENPKLQLSAIYSLYHVLLNIIKLFAPFMPHITEEIYQALFANSTEASIHGQNMWPLTEDFSPCDIQFQEAENLVLLLDLVRKSKAERNLSIKAEIARIEVVSHNELILEENIKKDFLNVVNSAEIIYVKDFTDQGHIQDEGNVKINIIYREAP